LNEIKFQNPVEETIDLCHEESNEVDDGMAAFLEPEVLLKEDDNAEKYFDLEKLIFGSSQVVVDLDDNDPLAVTAEDFVRAIRTPDPPPSQPSLRRKIQLDYFLVRLNPSNVTP